MKKILSIVAAVTVLASAAILHAEEKAGADKITGINESRVSYDIKTVDGEDLVITADYASSRPNPEIENIDISPKDPINEGTRVFKVMTKEGTPIELHYIYEKGERVGMKISAESPNPSSDAEFPQILSVKSEGGRIINFTFIWQGEDLKEVRIEPLVNPFAANRAG